MGLFSGIKKGLSSVWKGIKKRFKRALGHIGKFMNTGFGKALMVIVSIWTMGAALAAGYAAWGAAAAKEGATMVSKFVAAGQAVMSSVTGVGGAEKASATGLKEGVEVVDKSTQALNAAKETQGLATIQGQGPGSELIKEAIQNEGLSSVVGKGSTGADVGLDVAGMEAVSEGAANLNPTAADFAKADSGGGLFSKAQGGGQTGQTGVSALNAANPSNVAGAGTDMNFLGKLKKYGGELVKGAGEFAKTPAGLQTLGQIVGGVGTTMLQKQILDDERRYNRKQGTLIGRYIDEGGYGGGGFDIGTDRGLSRNTVDRPERESKYGYQPRRSGRIRMGGVV